MNNISNQLTIIPTLLIFGGGGIFALPANAARITYELEVAINSGPLVGNVYTGVLSYDDTSLIGVGSEAIAAEDFTFTFEGTTYTQADSPVFVSFFDGEFLGLDYSIASPPAPTFISGFFSVFDASFSYDFGAANLAGTGIPTYTFSSIPESSSLTALFLLAGLGITSKVTNKSRK